MKRILSSAIILPLVLGVFVFGNKYVVDVFTAIVAIRCIHELFHAFEQKRHHPVKPIGYIAALSICFLHIIPREYALYMIGAIIPLTILISFFLTILKKTKTNIIDIAITFFGVCYIVLFLIFVPIIRNMLNGKWLIWYLFIASWMTDVFAYLVGIAIGKHHFTDISPKKTIEGCIGGVLGATLCMVLYTIAVNKFTGMNINYFIMAGFGIILSIISQIGDLSASVIKRYAGIKDYSNLIPGHGGMLDRIDSLIFIAPFTYFMMLLIL